jgi:hypothetical protein
LDRPNGWYGKQNLPFPAGRNNIRDGGLQEGSMLLDESQLFDEQSLLKLKATLPIYTFDANRFPGQLLQLKQLSFAWKIVAAGSSLCCKAGRVNGAWGRKLLTQEAGCWQVRVVEHLATSGISSAQMAVSLLRSCVAAWDSS